MKHASRYTRCAAVLGTALLSSALVCAQSTQPPPTSPADDEIIELSPFEVSSNRDVGYQATDTLGGTRIRTELRDVGSAISVVTKEFIDDIGATDNSTLLHYTPNAEVAGTRGTYAGLGNATGVDETGNLRAPSGAQRLRGLAAADNTRDFFITDIPTDFYNVDRVDIQRGPNSILFGLGSPAGIINAQIRNAGFTTRGDVTARMGSYGTWRTTLDYNHVLVENTLAVRINALYEKEKFQQDPAFEKDKRIFGAIRWEPRLFKNRDFRTSIKVKFESGDIEANRPRNVTPQDSITPWFRPVDNTSLSGGAGKLAVTDPYALGANLGATNFHFTAPANQQQPLWFLDGATGEQYRIYGGHINRGARTTTGGNRGSSNSLLGQRYSEQFFALTNLAAFATNARLPGSQFGQYRNASLLDDSIFDFYNNLIDGPNKSEFEDWDALNIDVSQTGWGDRVGVQFTYDHQKYKRGGEGLLGNPTLNIDLTQSFQDLSTNPNFARPFVIGGPGTGNSYESDRKYSRAMVFAEARADDFFDRGSFLAKLLGKHRFSGLVSNEEFHSENRAWRMHANSREWNGYWTQSDGSTTAFTERPPLGVIYLGGSLASATSASGANIPGVQAPIMLNNGGVYHFNSTWRADPGIGFADPWDVPVSLHTMFSGAPKINPATGLPFAQLTQASNPDNYVGWGSGFTNVLRRYNDGRDPSLLTTAAQALRETRSYAGSWQGFLWNGAVVPTLGWRYDVVKGKNVAARAVANNQSILNLQPDVYRLPDAFPANQTFKDHSTSGGVVVHLNRILEKDPLPINVSLSYNKSSNFQVTGTRRDFFGNVIANPTGSTKDYGVLLATKDGKYSFRAIKYETAANNATTQANLGGLASTIADGLRFRNVFLYRMALYSWESREQAYDAATGTYTNDTGRRFWWHPAWVNSAGRPVASFAGNPTPIPAGAVFETDAQARAHGDASMRAWNAIQAYLAPTGFFEAWNMNVVPLSALTDRTTYEATLGPNTEAAAPGISPPYLVPVQNNAALIPNPASLTSYSGNNPPQGLSATADTLSKGFEYELTANPLPNWRLAISASETTATRRNVGGPLLDGFVAYMDEQIAGMAGDMRRFNGDYSAGNEVRQVYVNWRSQYTLLKLQEGTAAPEIRRWRYQFTTNYTFKSGWLKNVGLGGSYRWQDKVVIGYPVVTEGGNSSFDLSRPYYGPTEDAIDVFASYQRKINDKINWKIQLNIRNLGENEGLIPISVQPDGQTWASVRVKPVQEWFVTNTFSF